MEKGQCFGETKEIRKNCEPGKIIVVYSEVHGRVMPRLHIQVWQPGTKSKACMNVFSSRDISLWIG